MGRTLRSPTRKLTNRGPFPRVMGHIRCAKADTDPLVFDSQTALFLLLFLEHQREVVKIAFEPVVHRFEATADRPAAVGNPDVRVILDTGEIRWKEAKYSRKGLREKDKQRLAILASHLAAIGEPHEIVFGEDLRRDGFIQTVLLLRPFGLYAVKAKTADRACATLGSFGAAILEVWRSRAHAHGISTTLVYHLLYHQRLPLIYETVIPVELLPCRV
jgi:hypothetical protein